MREILQNKTADERRILEQTAEFRDWEFVEEFGGLILAQARLVGELPLENETESDSGLDTES